MNILLLSDFSRVAINATHYAMDLFQDQQVNFYLLNIFDPDPACVGDCAETRKADTLTTLQERVRNLQERSGNRQHKVTGHYSEDKLVNAARDFVKQNKIDLIVMGAVGKEQRHTTILGEHTFEIMSKIKCNILAVAEDSRFEKTEKLVMPLDYTAFFNENNIQFLNNSEIFKNTELSIWEIAGSGSIENERRAAKKEVFSGLQDINVSFSTFDETKIFDKRIWTDVQNKFDLVVLLGKNIRICDRLLHNRHGLYTSVPNHLPILVLHD
ncbi:universal stress protein [Salegentibacter sp. F188]|uniref:Universal stress protein n=1 Tax=Autumnicola patrickiae TaxID=3075591 RepID=A0ABU3DX08_9FLAO|nr:universal stress protein [Salegentibacter sp. F188]MDT0688252.1 universal stress protein [Salegentibacter sp. F188]